MKDTTRLQRSLAYTFTDPGLLDLALTHRSAGRKNNERLEFLGDSIVNHIVAEALYRKFPNADEGAMSRMRAALVKGETLAEVAQELQLGDYLNLGPGERKGGGRRRGSILADALEAVIGAILLDSSVERCRECVLALFHARLDALRDAPTVKDSKTRLQEYLQARHFPLPSYEVLSSGGNEHTPNFVVCCTLSKPALQAEGEGSSRQRAEQESAEAALRALENHGE